MYDFHNTLSIMESKMNEFTLFVKKVLLCVPLEITTQMDIKAVIFCNYLYTDTIRNN